MLGSGKTYHPGLPPNDDGNKSWSQDRPYQDLGDNGKWNRPSWLPQTGACKSSVMPDASDGSNLTDARNLEVILADMEFTANKRDADGKPVPFFMAYGIHKPHLPFHHPESFWDMYPETDDIALPRHEAAPENMPPIAFTYEMDGKSEIEVFGEGYPTPFPNASTRLPHNMTRAMRKGYYASVSWMDSLVGRALDKLRELGHDDGTVVALLGDHGWQLGEHNIWGKHSNFELGTRVPMIIHDPSPQGLRGNAVQDLVESVDLYPTIARLAGLPSPPDLDGVDLSPYVVAGSGAAPNKTAAFSEYPRCPSDLSKPWTDLTSCVHTHKQKFAVMGYSVRSSDWRYTVWLHWDRANLVGDFSRPPVGVELYDHRGDTEADFDAFENVNLAGQPRYKDVEAQHYAMAKAQWEKTKTPAASEAVAVAVA